MSKASIDYDSFSIEELQTVANDFIEDTIKSSRKLHGGKSMVLLNHTARQHTSSFPLEQTLKEYVQAYEPDFGTLEYFMQ